MIPEVDGDSTPLGQRPLSVLPVVYRLWASLRLGHLREWVEGWLPQSVFSLGNGLSSVEAWFSTAMDIKEVLSETGGDLLHVMVADVSKSFDTVDRVHSRLHHESTWFAWLVPEDVLCLPQSGASMVQTSCSSG